MSRIAQQFALYQTPYFLSPQLPAPYIYLGSKTPKVRKIGKKVQFFLYTPTILQCKDINKKYYKKKYYPSTTSKFLFHLIATL